MSRQTNISAALVRLAQAINAVDSKLAAGGDGVPFSCGFAARTSTQALSAATYTAITFTTELIDTHDAWDGTTFTVPDGQAGVYLFTGHATFAAVKDREITIVGVAIGASLSMPMLLGRGAGSTASTSLMGNGGAAVEYLNAGDTVRMAAYCHNATSLYNNARYNHFAGFRII